MGSRTLNSEAATAEAGLVRARAEDSRNLPVAVLTTRMLTQEDHTRLNSGRERVVEKGSRDLDGLQEEVRRRMPVLTRQPPARIPG